LAFLIENERENMQHFFVTYLDENRHPLGQPVSMVRASLKEVTPENLNLIIGGRSVIVSTTREVVGTDAGNPPITNVLVHCTRQSTN
jgi:hypothetical protein